MRYDEFFLLRIFFSWFDDGSVRIDIVVSSSVFMLSSSVHINSSVKRRFHGVDISPRRIVQKSLAVYRTLCVCVCLCVEAAISAFYWQKLMLMAFSLFVFLLKWHYFANAA